MRDDCVLRFLFFSSFFFASFLFYETSYDRFFEFLAIFDFCSFLVKIWKLPFFLNFDNYRFLTIFIHFAELPFFTILACFSWKNDQKWPKNPQKSGLGNDPRGGNQGVPTRGFRIGIRKMAKSRNKTPPLFSLDPGGSPRPGGRGKSQKWPKNDPFSRGPKIP